MMKNTILINIQHQNGAILVSSIIILTLLTLIGISALSKSVLDEKMANNSYNTELAFQASEAALRSGENLLKNLTAIPTTLQQCEKAPCEIIWDQESLSKNYGDSTFNWWSATNPTTNSSWWRTYGRNISSANAENKDLPYVSEQPSYFVEILGFMPDDLNPATRAGGEGYYYYRITSRGVGSNYSSQDNTLSQVILQSIYSKRYN